MATRTTGCCCGGGGGTMALLLLAAAAAAIAASPDPVALDKSVEVFAANVYKEMSSRSGRGNLLVCPLSVQSVLALLQSGAVGRTAAELSRSLLLHQDARVTRRFFGRLSAGLSANNGRDLQVLMTNRIYAGTDVSVSPHFRSVAVDSFSADVQSVDFGRADLAAAEINRWVRANTGDKIRELVRPGDISPDTRMMLVNALYFGGKWQRAFGANDTVRRPFHAPATAPVPVPTMRQTGRFRYAELGELDARVVELPYLGNDYALLVALPNRRDGLRDLEAHVAQLLETVEAALDSADVDLSLPRFTVEARIDFNRVLENLGVREAFSAAADFRNVGTVDGDRLRISKVLQKTFIDVNEEGTQAAAATSVGAITLSFPVPVPKVTFTADHPFMFVIRSARLNAPVFIGRYEVP